MSVRLDEQEIHNPLFLLMNHSYIAKTFLFFVEKCISRLWHRPSYDSIQFVNPSPQIRPSILLTRQLFQLNKLFPIRFTTIFFLFLVLILSSPNLNDIHSFSFSGKFSEKDIYNHYKFYKKQKFKNEDLFKKY